MWKRKFVCVSEVRNRGDCVSAVSLSVYFSACQNIQVGLLILYL